MENSDVRNLIYVGIDNESPTILDCVNSGGWNVIVVPDIHQVCKIIGNIKAYVGIIEIQNVHDEQCLSAIEALMLCSSKIEWIGLFPRLNLNYYFVKKMIGSGFYDYHTLPHNAEGLLFTLEHAYGMAKMKWDTAMAPITNSGMIGNSKQLNDVLSAIDKVASVTAPVLISGESGTGKELAARAIHDRSSFAQGPFVAVNCGAIASTLVQSELFGYEKGAFTGANKRKIGYLEAADGGTIFLDEIGDLPLEQQINLLRFLQEKTIQRVGGTEHIHVDVRVISATHVNLEQAVVNGRLREDLYYRLNVLQIKTPSLREREGDIPILANYFFDKFSNEKQPYVKGFSQECLKTMEYYAWKGNIREMINRIRRGMVMCENKLIVAADLGIEVTSSNFEWLSLKQIKENAEQQAIVQALERTQQNISIAARHLGISRVMLYRLIDKYDINIE